MKDGRDIVQKTIAASGGELWQHPLTLRLSGKARFTPFGETEKAIELDQYDMYRVFPNDNQAAHKANGKVRFDAFFQGQLFFKLRFDGRQSNMELGEVAQPYATHFKWSNNFGFGIFRFATQEGFLVQRLEDDQVEGHDCHFLKITDPSKQQTFFAVDTQTFNIRMVGFTTEIGYHHRIYSDFETAPNGFAQPTRMRVYFDGIKWMDVDWQTYFVNQPIADQVFAV